MARIFDLLILAGTALLSVRLFASGLHRRYRVFFYYLIFATLQAGVAASLKPAGRAYQKFFVLSQPVEFLLYVLVVLEIYALVLQDYRGLSTVGRWTLIAAVLVSVLASVISLTAPSRFSQSLVMTYEYQAARAAYFSLVVFLLSILGFLAQYPITLSRNIIVHSMVFSVYFLGNTVLYLLLSMHGAGPVVRYALPVITLGAVGAWLVMLNPASELRKLRLRPQWMPGREEVLVSQLNHLNAALLRATGNRPK